MTKYPDSDKDNCPEDYMDIVLRSTSVCFSCVEGGGYSRIDLDFDSVVALQQELGQWLLGCKENQCE